MKRHELLGWIQLKIHKYDYIGTNKYPQKIFLNGSTLITLINCINNNNYKSLLTKTNFVTKAQGVPAYK